MREALGQTLAEPEERRFRRVLGKFATGVGIVTYLHDGQPAGMTANAFMAVSLAPQLVLISVRNTSRLIGVLARGDRYAVNILAHDQDALSDHFGGRARPGDGPVLEMRDGVPMVSDCLAVVVARIVDLHAAGDHTLVIGQVERLEERAAAPLIFFGGQYERLGAAGA